MEACAEALVDQYWGHIESIAKALLAPGAVTGDIRTVLPQPGFSQPQDHAAVPLARSNATEPNGRVASKGGGGDGDLDRGC